MKLRAKLFMAGLLPALLTLLIILGVVYTQSVAFAQTSAKTLAVSLTKANGRVVQSLMERAAELDRSLTDLILNRDALLPKAKQAQAIADLFRKTLERSDWMFGVWIVLEKGVIAPQGASTAQLFDPKGHYSF